MAKTPHLPLLSIAVDGPVGAGKSTLCGALAKKLDILHLDTGAMYRAVGLYALEHGISQDDEAGLKKAIEKGDLQISVAYIDGQQHTCLNRQDVSASLRGETVGKAASAVSRFAPVRSYLVSLQQQLATKQSLLIDGRDIGTVVLPNAKIKIFLTATPEARAMRRYQQLLSAGQAADYQTVLEDLLARDAQDKGRAVTPLRQADDAILLDTTEMSFEESLNKMLEIVNDRYGK